MDKSTKIWWESLSTWCGAVSCRLNIWQYLFHILSETQCKRVWRPQEEVGSLQFRKKIKLTCIPKCPQEKKKSVLKLVVKALEKKEACLPCWFVSSKLRQLVTFRRNVSTQWASSREQAETGGGTDRGKGEWQSQNKREQTERMLRKAECKPSQNSELTDRKPKITPRKALKFCLT